MTAQELIEILKTCPTDTEVKIHEFKHFKEDFTYEVEQAYYDKVGKKFYIQYLD